MTLNPDFALNCVLRQHVWSSEAWLSKHMASLISFLVRNVVGELQRKRTLAASRGFLAAARLSCYMIHPSDERTDGRATACSALSIQAICRALKIRTS